MDSETPPTPDETMIKSWIASLQLLHIAVEAAVSYENYLRGDDIDDEPTPDEIYMGKISTAKQALRDLLHE